MKVIIIPQDAREPIREMEFEGDRLQIAHIRSHTNIEYFEVVKTVALADLGLVALVDDDGFSKNSHSLNMRGMLLAQYQGNGGQLVGDMMLTRQAFVGEGYDCTPVQEGDLIRVKEVITAATAGMI